VTTITNKHIDDYIDYCTFEAGLRDETIRTTRNLLYRFYRFLLTLDTPVDVTHISEEIFLIFLQHLEDKNSTSATIRHNKTVISGMLQYLNRCGRLTENFTMEPHRSERKVQLIISEPEMRKMCSLVPTCTIADIRDRAFIELSYSCGLRFGEITTLKVKDILSDDTLLINGKGGKQRVGIINPVAGYWIKRYLSLRKNVLKSSLLFVNSANGKLVAHQVKYILTRAAKRAGIKVNVTLHTIRRSFATHLADGGMDIAFISKLLGHKSITTTEKHYITINNRRLKKAMELQSKHTEQLRATIKSNTDLNESNEDRNKYKIPIFVKGYKVKFSDDFIKSLPAKFRNEEFYQSLSDFYQAAGKFVCYKNWTPATLGHIKTLYKLQKLTFSEEAFNQLREIEIISLHNIYTDLYGKPYDMFSLNKPEGVKISRDKKKDYNYYSN